MKIAVTIARGTRLWLLALAFFLAGLVALPLRDGNSYDGATWAVAVVWQFYCYAAGLFLLAQSILFQLRGWRAGLGCLTWFVLAFASMVLVLGSARP